MRRTTLAVLVASAVALLAPAAAQALNVYAATSLTNVFPALDKSPTYSFGGSNTLQLQIERGAPADVFASASPTEAQALFREGLCTRPVTFAINRLVLLIPNANPGHVTSVYSLRSGGRRLSIGTAGVPIGAYTRQLLKRMRLSSILSSNTRQPADQRGPGRLPGRPRRGRRRLRLLHRRPRGQGPHEDDQPAQVGPAAGALPDLRGHAAPGADTSGAAAFIKKVTGKAGRGALKALRLRATAAQVGAARGVHRAAGALHGDHARVPGDPDRRALHRRCRSATSPACCATPAVQDALEGHHPHEPARQRADPRLRDPDGVVHRATALPGAGARGDARRAAARAAAGGGRHRRCWPRWGPGACSAPSCAARGSSCRSPRPQWCSRWPSSPRPSTSARRSVRSSRSTRTFTDAARTLGAGPGRTFWRIGLPLAAGGLLAGWVLAFARGVGEFGATIIFAGNVRGQTQTLTLTIYEQLESNLDVALAIGVLLVVLSGGVLLSYKMFSSWRRSSSTSPSRLRSFELGVSLSIGAETVALVGPSGAGKTTVLRAIAGLRRPDRGRIALGERAWFDAAAKVDLPPERRSVGLVFQEYALFPHMTVRAQRRLRGRERRPRGRAAGPRAASRHLADERPGGLSGRRAPARGGRARPGARPAGPAARRAALGARRAHARAWCAASCRTCSPPWRCRRCS